MTEPSSMNNFHLLSAESSTTFRVKAWCFTALLFLLSAALAQAYPPAPHHLFYGLVRDEYGSPVNVPGAEGLLVTFSGQEVKTHAILDLELRVNYQLEVPIDA